MVAAALGVGLSLATPASGAPKAGINLAGGEFNSGRRPGTYAKDYIYPDGKVAQPFIAMGMKIVRVPILWERLQPEPMKPLSGGELARLDKALATLRGFEVIVLDVHNYGKFKGQRLDRIEDGGNYLADLWGRLADRYKGDRQIAFGLMNEPNGISPTAWRRIADASLNAIRRAGAKNLVLVPGSNWTGAHSWHAGGRDSNAAAFASFRDPASNYALEMHQYLDADSSGTKPQCVAPAIALSRIKGATAWLRANGHRGFLGEFGAATDAACLASLDALLAHVHANEETWMGWAYWAGGPWWGARYPMSVQPVDGKARPQAAVLARYVRGGKKAE